MKILFGTILSAVFLLLPFAALAQDQSPAAQAATPRISLVRVYVTDLARSETFYREVFGLSAPQAYGERERVFTLSSDENGPRLVLALTDTPRPNGSFALVVSDIDGVFERTPNFGGTVARPAQKMADYPVLIGFVTDPDGASIEIIEVIQPAAP